MNTATAKTPTVGDNRPPLVTTEQLQIDFEHLEREAVAAAMRAELAPSVVEDDDDIADMRKMARDLVDAHRKLEDARVETKDPYLAAERVVDGYFNPLKKRLSDLKVTLEARAKRYLDKKAAEERKRQAEVAEAARREQERLADEAAAAAAKSEPVQASVAAQAAKIAAFTAEQAEHRATAKPADLARTRTGDGGMATLKQEWSFEIEDIAKVPLESLREFIPLPEINKAIARFVDRHKGDRELAGVRIFQTTKAQLR